MAASIVEIIGIILALLTMVLVGIGPILAVFQDDSKKEAQSDFSDSIY